MRKRDFYISPERLDRTSPTALYHQIYTQLRKEIMLGGYKEGERFFSFRKLKNIYGVEAKTIGNAVELLARDGFLAKRPASGIYIADLNKIRNDNMSIGTIWYVVLGEDLDHPFYFQLLKGIEKKAHENNLRVITGVKDSVKDFLDWFAPESEDGLIITGEINKKIINKIKRTHMGHMVVEGLYELPEGTANISVDVYSGILKALESARHNGVHRIGLIAGPEERLVTRTIIKALRDFERENSSEIEYIGSYLKEDENGYKGMEYLMDGKNPDCVIVTEPGFSGVCRYALKHNLKYPEDIFIIRYGKEPPVTGYDDMAALNICGNTRAMGEKAVEMLLNHSEGVTKEELKVEKHVLAEV